MILVTGSAGFIGSNFVSSWLDTQPSSVLSLDALTYAGNRNNIKKIDAKWSASGRHSFIHGNICDRNLIDDIFLQAPVTAVINFAAETHVDRSISSPANFVNTNVLGTFNLLEASRAYMETLSADKRLNFRFLHVSTDEVYGSLDAEAAPFTESSVYRPNSPYSASKAASDHFVRAYHQTYNLPALTTNCSNNYGPHQFPEKLIPLCIHHALSGKQLPIYGDGQQIRDWLFVEDHCSAIRRVLEEGIPGEIYNIGGRNQKTNLEVVNAICTILDSECPRKDGVPYATQIAFVRDRPGHDRRYAINTANIERQLGWRPQETFETGLRKTVRWYLDNQDWVANVTSGAYRHWIDIHYENA